MPVKRNVAVRGRRVFPPTPQTSSPPPPGADSFDFDKRDTSATGVGDSGYSDSSDTDSRPHVQLSRIARYLLHIETQDAPPLKIESPCEATLQVLGAAIDSESPQALFLAPGLRPLLALLACVPAYTLKKKTRYRYTLSPHCLTIRPMTTAVHDCVIDFVKDRFLHPSDSPLTRILSPGELSRLRTRANKSTPLPGGPVELGYHDPVASVAPDLDSARKKRRALDKQPDIAIRFEPNLVFSKTYSCTDSGDDDGDDASNDNASNDNTNNETSPAQASEVPTPNPFPPIIFEVGYSESYDDLLADVADYLISARGEIKLAILINIDYVRATQPCTTTTTTTTTHQHQHQPDTTESPPASPPPLPASESDPEDYKRKFLLAQDPAVVDAHLPRFTVFVEAWTYTPTMGPFPSSTPAHLRHISLRAPGRTWLMRAGVPQRHAGVRMCRGDFGLAGGGASGGGGADEARYISFSGLNPFIVAARTEMVYKNLVKVSKAARAGKRVREGENDGDFRQVEGENEEGGAGRGKRVTRSMTRAERG